MKVGARTCGKKNTVAERRVVKGLLVVETEFVIHMYELVKKILKIYKNLILIV